MNFSKEELLSPQGGGVCRLNLMPMPAAVKAMPVMCLSKRDLYVKMCKDV